VCTSLPVATFGGIYPITTLLAIIKLRLAKEGGEVPINTKYIHKNLTFQIE